MSNYRSIPYTEREKEQITRYLIGAQSYTDKQYFQGKCLGYCHVFKRHKKHSRSMDEWRRIVERLEIRCPLLLGPLEAEQILSYLSIVAAKSNQELQESQDRNPYAERSRFIFEEKCGSCHLLSIVLEYDARSKTWRPILERMGDKSPEFLPVEEALFIEPYLLSLDKKDFSIEFPHSFSFREIADECN